MVKPNESATSEEKLNTEEILSIVQKSEKKFNRNTQISGKISRLFKKQPIKEIAKEDERQHVQDNNEKVTEKNLLVDKVEEEIKSEISDQNTTEPESKNIVNNLKKYTEEEANTKAKELAKKYYYYGYNLGVKNIKKELLKGENKISIALKNVLDNLFLVSEKLTSELNDSLNKKTFQICNEIIGYEIDSRPEKFLKKITELTKKISNSVKNAKILLNKDDHNLITKHIEVLKKNLSIEFDIDQNLERGDLRIVSGDIELEEINSEKIRSSNDSKIDLSVISEDE
tara:strand:- start:8834 stop:9688 length:855 start_codon:yes stop_codon:yes gene_type:complete